MFGSGRVGFFRLSKSLAEFAPAGANKVLTIFSGDMRVGENTSRLANALVLPVGREQRRVANPAHACGSPK